GKIEYEVTDTEPETRFHDDTRVDSSELHERAPYRATGAGGVLHQEPGRGALAALEQLAHRLHDPLQARVEAGAEVRADVEDDRVGLDRAPDLDRVLERRDRLVVERVVRAREVDEVEGVADDGADPGLRAPLLE